MAVARNAAISFFMNGLSIVDIRAQLLCFVVRSSIGNEGLGVIASAPLGRTVFAMEFL
jgi:hypothetical protein